MTGTELRTIRQAILQLADTTKIQVMNWRYSSDGAIQVTIPGIQLEDIGFCGRCGKTLVPEHECKK